MTAPRGAASGPSHAAALLAPLCERLDDAIILVSSQRRVLWLNAAARTLLGITEDAVDRPLAETVSDYRLPMLVNTAFERAEEGADELGDVLAPRTVLPPPLPAPAH